jgi:hypothetical protein
VYIKIYDDVITIMDWFSANKLSLNLDKTKYMLFNPHVRNKVTDIPNLKINNKVIERVSKYKFLGVHLDDKINWKEHINHICTKLHQNKYLINNIKHLIPKKHLISMYYAHINSHLTYGMYLWGPMISQTTVNKLYNEQKKILRYIENETYTTDYNKIHKTNRILKILDMIKCEILKFSYKLNNQLLPAKIEQFFDKRPIIHHHNTRRRNDVRSIKHKSAVFGKSILKVSAHEWSKISLEDRTASTVKQFIMKIKDKIIKNYKFS